MSRIAFVAFALLIVSLHAQAAAIPGQGTWETTLQPRDADPDTAGIEAYYDTALNITWLANANLADTNTFGLPGILSDGSMDWVKAKQWIAALNAANYLGASNWRMPTVTDLGSSGCNFSYAGTDCGYNVNPVTSEMAHMFYITLGNAGLYDVNGQPTGCSGSPPYCLTNTGPFANIQTIATGGVGDAEYWSGTQYRPPMNAEAWNFMFGTGRQNHNDQFAPLYVWAVRSEDIALVPLPPAALLFGGALAALAAIRRRAAAA